MATVLDGVQVVEVADWGFVPSAGTALGDWGAEVVKIEHPRHGDPIRGLITGGMIPGASGRNFIVEALGRHKRSVGIDLGTDEGRALLYRLVERADVFLTNFLPDARERLRITYEDLKRVNPRLVYAKGHGQGARGPDARRGGYDGVSFWARGGIADRLSTTGGPYVQQRPAFGDFIGGMCIAGRVAAALFRRATSGRASCAPRSASGGRSRARSTSPGTRRSRPTATCSSRPRPRVRCACARTRSSSRASRRWSGGPPRRRARRPRRCCSSSAAAGRRSHAGRRAGSWREARRPVARHAPLTRQI